MRVLSDNDVGGIVAVLRRVLESPEWRDYTAILDLEFVTFEDLDLPRDATDRQVWMAAQTTAAVLLTANRAGRPDSLEHVLEDLLTPTSLPVITLADPQRILTERPYALRAAVKLLDFLDQIENFRGAGRLFVP